MRMAAVYARVSSEQQRETHTIASQTAALIEWARTLDVEVPKVWVFEDEGYSGATLERPGLERVRDLAAEGQIQAVLVYSPDRLSRKYAYQILLIEELARHGVETRFLNAPQAATAEDQLVVQFQGMIAEYERAQILERSRRGKRHRARAGEISVLSGAPYGYRYIRKSEDAPASYVVIDAEARVVRQVYDHYTTAGWSIGAITRWLNDQCVATRKPGARWERSMVWAMLRNPAYRGMGCFGKTRVAPRQRVTRTLRMRGGMTTRNSAHHERSREEWIEIPVPALITEETFARAQELLHENKVRARRRTIEPQNPAVVLRRPRHRKHEPTPRARHLVDPRSVSQTDLGRKRGWDYRPKGLLEDLLVLDREAPQVRHCALALEAVAQGLDVLEASRAVAEERREDDRRDVPQGNLVVCPPESRRSGPPKHHSLGILEVDEVVRSASAKRNGEAGASGAPARAADPLCVVERLRRNVPEEDRVEISQVDTKLERCGGAQHVDLSIGKVSLELASLLDIELCRVLFGAERCREPILLVKPAVVVGREILVARSSGFVADSGSRAQTQARRGSRSPSHGPGSPRPRTLSPRARKGAPASPRSRAGTCGIAGRGSGPGGGVLGCRAPVRRFPSRRPRSQCTWPRNRRGPRWRDGSRCRFSPRGSCLPALKDPRACRARCPPHRSARRKSRWRSEPASRGPPHRQATRS